MTGFEASGGWPWQTNQSCCVIIFALSVYMTSSPKLPPSYSLSQPSRKPSSQPPSHSLHQYSVELPSQPLIYPSSQPFSLVSNLVSHLLIHLVRQLFSHIASHTWSCSPLFGCSCPSHISQPSTSVSKAPVK